MKAVFTVQKVLGAAPLTALTQISNGDTVLRLVPMQGRKRKVSVLICMQLSPAKGSVFASVFCSFCQVLYVSVAKELAG